MPFMSSIEKRAKDERIPEYEVYKSIVQSSFKSNALSAIVATKSFGMGVNKPNIRIAIHCGLPSSIEALYQEAGRAGRDGQKAKCILIINLFPQVDPLIADLDTSYNELAIWNKNKKPTKMISEHRFFSC